MMSGPWEKYGGTTPTAPAMGDPIVKAAPAPTPPSPLEQRRVDIAERSADLAERKFSYEQEQGAKKPAAGTAADPKVAGKAAALDSVVSQINRVQELYDSGIRDETFSNLFGALDGIGPEAGQFDSAGAALGDQGMAAFKVPGMGPQSDQDAARFVAANQPQSSDWDIRIEEKLRSLRSRVDANRAALGLPPAQWRGQADDREKPPVFGPGDPQYVAATEGTRTVTDPQMARVADQYRQMLSENRKAGEIIGFLKANGASTQTLMQAMQQIKYRQQNPNVPVDKYRIEATTEVPLSGFEKTVTDYGDNAAGAYAAGAGQMLTANTLDNLTGDPERARLSLQLAQAQSPNAFGLGEVSGGVLAGLTGEAGLARAGMAAGIGRGVLADSAMGAANGAGMADNGGRGTNALLGAVTGAAGSLGGAAVSRGIGNALAPTGGRMAQLYKAGVRPTPGQRFSESGVAGRLLNTTEEALQSVPVVGSAIRGARQEARDQFQIAAFDQALAEVGEKLPKGMKPGTSPHAYAQKVFDRVYDEARSGMHVVADEELSNDIGSIFDNVKLLASPSQNRFKAITQNVVMRRLDNGHLSGDAYKKAYSDLGKQIRGIRNNPSGDGELADALQELQSALDGAARRHSDPAAVELLDAADAGYSRLVRIEDAAKSRGGDAGTFTATQFDRSVQRTSGGVRSKAYLRGDALMQDFAEAGKGLDDKLPNSGTADRVMAGYAVGAPVAGTAAFFEPTTATVLGAVGAAYAPGVRKATKAALAPSGPTASRIAARLKRRARLIGSATSATAVAALPGTSPGQ